MTLHQIMARILGSKMAASGSLHLRRREREELQQENGHARGRVCSGSKEEGREGWQCHSSDRDGQAIRR